MIHLIVQASKYLMIFLFLVYTFECFHVFKFEGEEEDALEEDMDEPDLSGPSSFSDGMHL